MGAWIETRRGGFQRCKDTVAPRVGAWIETTIPWSLTDMALTSHPEWVRGLKLDAGSDELDGHLVAPRVGAWIETAD